MAAHLPRLRAALAHVSPRLCTSGRIVAVAAALAAGLFGLAGRAWAEAVTVPHIPAAPEGWWAGPAGGLVVAASALVAAALAVWTFSSRRKLVRTLREQTRARQDLETEILRTRMALDSATDAIGMADAAVNPVFVNRRFVELLGYSVADIRAIGGPPALFTDRDLILRIIATIQSGESWTGELEIIAANGRPLPILLRAGAVKNAEGSVVGLIGIMTDLSERNRALEQLRESEERFGATFDEVGVGIGHTALDGRFLRVNRKLCEMFGYSAQELLQLTFQNLTHPDDVGPTLANIERLLRGEIDSCAIEKRCIRKNGSFFWGRLTVSLVREESGPPKYLIGVLADITAQKEAIDALRRSEASLANAQRIARLGSWDWDILTNQLLWSDEIYRIFGLRPQQFGATYEAFLARVHPEDQRFVKDAVNRALWERAPYSVDHRILLPDGRERIAHEQAEVYYDELGQPVRMSGTVQDVTERRQTEERLRKLSRAVEQSPNIILITDTDGVIEYVNPKFTEITGYTAEEAVGRTPAMLNSGLTPSPKYKELWETLTAGDEWRGEFLNRRKNGEFFWCEESITPIFDDSGNITHFLAIEDDVTERRKIVDQLRQAQKMETVGQLAGGIAHDFNNLLMVISGNLDLLLDRLPKKAKTRHFAARALRAASHGAELANRLLVFSRHQALQPQAVDVGALVRGMSDLLRSTLMESIAIEIAVPDGLWHAMVDPVQLENALFNLAINARDAMPDGGTLAIEIANVDLSHEDLAGSPDVMPGSYVRISLTDTGVGMPPDVLKRAFEPFFTTKDVGKGSGLGLSMVYGLVKQSGGHITIASGSGRGTRVDLYLPRTEPRAAATPRNLDPCGPAAGESVLVVEDNAEVRRVATDLLRQLGYRTIEAASGPEALEVLESDRPLDLLFTDIVMPGGMNGWELAHKALGLRPGLKVLFATGYTAEEAPAAMQAATSFRLLGKPYRKADLERAVREVLDAAG